MVRIGKDEDTAKFADLSHYNSLKSDGGNDQGKGMAETWIRLGGVTSKNY